VNENQKTLVALVAMLVFVLVWAGCVVGCCVVACQPGQAGAVLMVVFALCVGWGFFQDTRAALGEWLG